MKSNRKQKKNKAPDSRARAGNTLTVAIQFAAAKTTTTPSAILLRRWCCAALQQQQVSSAEICLRLVDGRESAALNKRYRGKSGATNVLSFATEPLDRTDGNPLGDIVICAPLVAREARAQAMPTYAHWAHLVVHGTLHLLGFDHIRNADASRMEALEIKILDQLGFDNPYN